MSIINIDFNSMSYLPIIPFKNTISGVLIFLNIKIPIPMIINVITAIPIDFRFFLEIISSCPKITPNIKPIITIKNNISNIVLQVSYITYCFFYPSYISGALSILKFNFSTTFFINSSILFYLLLNSILTLE